MKRAKRIAPKASSKAELMERLEAQLAQPRLRDQVQATFDPNVTAYLKDLHASGLYGATIGEVIDGLVCAGIRDALHSEHIKRRTFGKRRAT